MLLLLHPHPLLMVTRPLLLLLLLPYLPLPFRPVARRRRRPHEGPGVVGAHRRAPVEDLHSPIQPQKPLLQWNYHQQRRKRRRPTPEERVVRVRPVKLRPQFRRRWGFAEPRRGIRVLPGLLRPLRQAARGPRPEGRVAALRSPAAGDRWLGLPSFLFLFLSISGIFVGVVCANVYLNNNNNNSSSNMWWRVLYVFLDVLLFVGVYM
ncbi:uncharacterized protein M6B38_216205 [Iris pallida]|uniref:Uncharacterized protein n=1 Tax=Iris pallida TaxID=29817 RepID=A0AAX6E1D3_IRIPA|nr:uncharacterized protein M6B38_216205 [Iris pallida]